MKKLLKFRGKRIYLTELQHLSVEVYENKHYRWLRFGNQNIQSAMSKKVPWQAVLSYIPALMLPLANHHTKRRGLLLGLGGGALIHYLLHHYPESTLDAVEVEAEVIKVARQYFDLPEHPSLNVIHADANDYLRKTHPAFDFILCDIYSSDNFPRHCSTKRFFQSCLTNLDENGSFSINIIADSTQQCRSLLLMIQEVFNKQTLLVPVTSSSNIILHAFKHRQRYNETTRALSKHKKVIWDAEWGMIVEL